MDEHEDHHPEEREIIPPEEHAIVDKHIFVNALTTSEMAVLLREAIEKKRQVNPAYQPPPVMQKTLDNSTHFGKLKNKESLESLRM